MLRKTAQQQIAHLRAGLRLPTYTLKVHIIPEEIYQFQTATKQVPRDDGARAGDLHARKINDRRGKQTKKIK